MVPRRATFEPAVRTLARATLPKLPSPTSLRTWNRSSSEAISIVICSSFFLCSCRWWWVVLICISYSRSLPAELLSKGGKLRRADTQTVSGESTANGGFLAGHVCIICVSWEE